VSLPLPNQTDVLGKLRESGMGAYSTRGFARKSQEQQRSGEIGVGLVSDFVEVGFHLAERDDPRYRYGEVPFTSQGMAPETLAEHCIRARNAALVVVQAAGDQVEFADPSSAKGRPPGPRRAPERTLSHKA
jgi:hypothetical protein